MGRKVMDLTGKKFGKSTIIKRSYPNKNGHLMWLCKCDCGTEKIIEGNHLRSGHTKSCGCLQSLQKLTPELASMRQLINGYKKGAKKRGYSYELTEEQFAELTQKNCYYCGAKPKGHYGKYIYSGIDRIDNDKGYVMDNVVPCCKFCNRKKSNLTLQEFKNWIKKVSDRILPT